MQLYSWHFEQWWLRWRSVKISAIVNLYMWDGIKLKAIKWYKEPEVLFVGWSLKHLLYNYIDYLTFNFTIFDGFPHGPTPWQDGLRARSYSVHCYQFHNSEWRDLIGHQGVIQASDWPRGIQARRSDQDRCYEPCTRSLESEMSEQTLLSYL